MLSTLHGRAARLILSIYPEIEIRNRNRVPKSVGGE